MQLHSTTVMQRILQKTTSNFHHLMPVISDAIQRWAWDRDPQLPVLRCWPHQLRWDVQISSLN